MILNLQSFHVQDVLVQLKSVIVCWVFDYAQLQDPILILKEQFKFGALPSVHILSITSYIHYSIRVDDFMETFSLI